MDMKLKVLGRGDVPYVVFTAHPTILQFFPGLSKAHACSLKLPFLGRRQTTLFIYSLCPREFFDFKNVFQSIFINLRCPDVSSTAFILSPEDDFPLVAF